ncbi:acetyl esterase [Plantibacter sp. VKM Ac-1784]|uniref:Acetyl esterase n=1 Tax=Plantibacter elymi (nom. nud.) TaxID=199708 RepID=A0ABY1RDV9_9MICO|nr:alpha/beta hydrolase [Plantibacter sp. VKM Ac-1784]SMQ71191.1 acetyl esterase [Plantibacter sp. VKM Ac-1784]
MSRIVIEAGIREWLVRLEELSSEIDLGVDPPDARGRTARQRLSDAVFAEFGQHRDWGVTVEDHVVAVRGGEIRVRHYRPQGAVGVLPGYLLLHGGAFWEGSIDESINQALASQRAAEGNVSLFDVDYRLAPEHPHPTPLEDAYAALYWVHEHHDRLGVDPDRLIIGGVSAGGNIAAALAHLAHDRGGPSLAGQILEVPLVDFRRTDRLSAEGDEVIGEVDLLAVLDAYAPGRSADDPSLSPAAGSLQGLPPTHIMTAEYDVIAAAAEDYVVALREAGVEVSSTRHLGMLHGAPGITGRVRQARLWQAEVSAVLREFGGR